MGEVYGLSKTSAVHLRIEYDKEQCKYCKESLESQGCYSCLLSEYACYQGSTYDGFRQRKCDSKRFGRKGQKLQMEEVHVFGHDQAGTDRVHEFKDSTDEEDEACDEAAETLQSEENIVHTYFIAESTTAFTLSKIAPGGSICPFSSEQSIRMNLGSISHCFL